MEELEGEVVRYKNRYEEMKRRMEGMEEQIRLLTEMNRGVANNYKEIEDCFEPHQEEKMVVTPPGSYPNSPSRLFQEDSTTTSTKTLVVQPNPQDIPLFFTEDFADPIPPTNPIECFSSLSGCEPDDKNNLTGDDASSFMNRSVTYPKEHLTISRQA
jgi:hypothetical protein